MPKENEWVRGLEVVLVWCLLHVITLLIGGLFLDNPLAEYPFFTLGLIYVVVAIIITRTVYDL